MSVWYYFYDSDNQLINDGGYAGMPDFWKYDLEKISPCDTCENKNNKDEFVCWDCYKPMQTKYKITKKRNSRTYKKYEM